MSAIRRIGLTRDPPGGWPLDRLFVGVATLRTTRELFSHVRSLRAWDLSLRTGVSPQGSANSLERLHQLGLVEEYIGEPWEASRFRLDSSHYLVRPLAHLFAAERDACRGAFAVERDACRQALAAERKAWREARWRGPSGGPGGCGAPPDGSSTPS